jgi:ABC-2 type transport system permease protein
MFEGLRHIITKEVIHTFRDKKMRVMIFGAPVIQLIVFGFAASFDVRDIRLIVDDQDKSQTSRALIERFTGSPYFSRVDDLPPKDADAALLSGRADLVLSVPSGYQRYFQRGGGAPVRLIIDGTNSNSASIIQNYAEVILSQANLELSSQHLGRAPASAAPWLKPPLIQPVFRFWYNELQLASHYMIPALFGLVLLIITVLLTAMGLTRERELGTYEQLIVSPLHPETIILGKTLPFAIAGLVIVTLILTAAWLIFGIVMKGSILLFYVSALIFILCTLSLGILISSLSETMQQAMMLTFLISLPMTILSGMMFPIENMPLGFQWLTYLNPARYFIEISRGLFLKGAGMAYVAPRVAVLFVMGLALLTIATARFQERLK